MNIAYLLIGGNMGHREGYLSKARNKILANCGTISKASSIYETAAWGVEDQSSFLNQVLCIQTSLTAEGLLKKILTIEEDLGRKRMVRYGPRIIDIDILLFNQEIIHQDGLTVPHPDMINRRFALTPLNEIAPQLVHPVFNKTIQTLLLQCKDKLDVHKF